METNELMNNEVVEDTVAEAMKELESSTKTIQFAGEMLAIAAGGFMLYKFIVKPFVVKPFLAKRAAKKEQNEIVKAPEDLGDIVLQFDDEDEE